MNGAKAAGESGHRDWLWNEPKPLFLAGATATGKSSVALELAKCLHGEIVAVDSMVVYRELNIGAAKPTVADREAVPHHLIDVADLSEAFNAARFAALAAPIITDIQRRGRVPILCGGAGLYFAALLDGLSGGPPSDARLRAILEVLPLEALLRELEQTDPESFQRIDRKNRRRVARAIEVIRLTGKPYSAQRAKWPSRSGDSTAGASGGVCFVALRRSTEDLRQRIDRRVDQMMAQGWIEEAKIIFQNGAAPNVGAGQAIGYKEILELLGGRSSLKTTTDLIKQRTKRYAKRQMTWFRRQADIRWIDLDPMEPPAATARKIAEIYRPPNPSMVGRGSAEP